VKSRLLVTILGIVILFLIIVGVGGALYILSDSFAHLVARQVGHALDADCHLESVTWRQGTFQSKGFTAQGKSDSHLASLKASGISLHIQWSKLFMGQIIVDQASINELTAVIGHGKSKPNTTSQSASHPSWIKPHFAIEKIQIQTANVQWTDGGGGQLAGTKIEATQATANNGWQITMTGGTIQQTSYPSARLKESHGYVAPDLVKVDQATFEPDGGGNVNMSGSFPLHSTQEAQAQMTFDHVQPGGFFPRKWAVHGSATGNVEFHGTLHHSSQRDLTGFVQVKDGSFDASELFGKARQVLKLGGIQQMYFDELKSNFHHVNHRTELTQFVVRYKDQALINGQGAVNGDQLNAHLQIGVKPGLIAWIPGATETVFNQSRDELQWADTNITGTIKQPKEDLSKRLLNAAKKQMKTEFNGQIKDAAKSLLNLLRH
jgi:hypothetical protein